MTENCEFKSAGYLGLTQKEWEALIITLMKLEAGQLDYVSRDALRSSRETPDTKHPFNMSIWNLPHTCGTVCCIGGSAEVLGGLSEGSLKNKASRLGTSTFGMKDALWRLFYHYPGEQTTPQEAGRALRGYLTTGQTDWGAATKDRKW